MYHKLPNVLNNLSGKLVFYLRISNYSYQQIVVLHIMEVGFYVNQSTKQKIRISELVQLFNLYFKYLAVYCVYIIKNLYFCATAVHLDIIILEHSQTKKSSWLLYCIFYGAVVLAAYTLQFLFHSFLCLCHKIVIGIKHCSRLSVCDSVSSEIAGAIMSCRYIQLFKLQSTGCVFIDVQLVSGFKECVISGLKESLY